jgi:hypothetical protein
LTVALSVAVASHERPLRLRWLLNALEEQTLPRRRWEVVVCFDDAGEETARLVATHPLAAAGVLRALRLAPGTATAAAQRNVAWRAARAPHVLFTDDDCRPPAGWLAAAHAAAQRSPGAIVQGATRPDPDELGLLRAPGWRSIEVDPPVTWAQTCNVLYPRAALEAAGGFDEGLRTTEDTDLALRVRAAGHALVGAPEVLTYHCVEVPSLPARVRATQRWLDIPRLVGRHPQLRGHFPLRVFWKPRHALLGPALLGLGLAATRRGRRPAALMALPWARAAAPSYGPGARGRLRAVTELPSAALVDAGEIVALARGSWRHRTLVL